MTGETDEEGVEKTVKWVADKGVNYGYAYDEGLELFGGLGLSYFPSAVLVDPFGNVVYTGHPSELSEKLIEDTLANVLPSPLGEWPEALAPVAEALRKGHYGPAKRALGALDASDLTKQVASFLDQSVEVRVAGLAAMVESLDVKGAMAALDGHADAFAGYDDALATMGKLTEALGGERAKEALAAQERLAEMEALLQSDELMGEDGMPDADRIRRLYREFQGIAKKFDGKAPGNKAAEWVDMLTDFVESLDAEPAGAGR